MSAIHWAAASMRCSQLSITSRVGRSSSAARMRPRTSTRTAGSLSDRRVPEYSLMPSVEANASGTSSPVRTLASSTTTTPGISSAARAAISWASRVLPSPPAPRMVVSRDTRVNRSTAAMSAERPTSSFGAVRMPTRRVRDGAASGSGARSSSALRATSSGAGSVPSSSRRRARNSPNSRIASLRLPADARARNRSSSSSSLSGADSISGVRSERAPNASPVPMRARARTRARSARSRTATDSSRSASSVSPRSLPGAPRQSSSPADASASAARASSRPSASRAALRCAAAASRSQSCDSMPSA